MDFLYNVRISKKSKNQFFTFCSGTVLGCPNYHQKSIFHAFLPVEKRSVFIHDIDKMQSCTGRITQVLDSTRTSTRDTVISGCITVDMILNLQENFHDEPQTLSMSTDSFLMVGDNVG